MGLSESQNLIVSFQKICTGISGINGIFSINLTFPKISRQFLVNFPKFIDIRPKKIDIILKLVDNHPKFIDICLYIALFASTGGS